MEWTRGEWANRGYVDSRPRPFDAPDIRATEQLLRNINPQTPIDPEGAVGYWEVPNFTYRPIWAHVTVVTPRRYATWEVMMVPVRDLKWQGDPNVERAIERLWPRATRTVVWWRGFFGNRTPTTVDYVKRLLHYRNVVE